MDNKVLIIAGMHRSGTSFVAQWLHASGLALGDVLLKGDPFNPAGHFEDRDFLRFHLDILAYNGIDSERYHGTPRIKYTEYHEARRNAYVQLKSQLYPQWGWKEPVNCLTLHFWTAALNKPYYLFVFRHYELVVDSLLRRSYYRYGTNPPLKERISDFWHQLHYRKKVPQEAALFLQAWIHYNQCLINFFQHPPEKAKNNCLLLSIESFSPNQHKIFQLITQQWGFILHPYNLAPRTKKTNLSFKLNFPQHLKEEAEQVWQKLKALNQQSLAQLESLS